MNDKEFQKLSQYEQLLYLQGMNRAEKRKLAKKLKMKYAELLESLEFKIDGENKCINKVLRIDTLVSDNYIKCIRMNDFHFIKVVNDKIIGN